MNKARPVLNVLVRIHSIDWSTSLFLLQPGGPLEPANPRRTDVLAATTIDISGNNNSVNTVADFQTSGASVTVGDQKGWCSSICTHWNRYRSMISMSGTITRQSNPTGSIQRKYKTVWFGFLSPWSMPNDLIKPTRRVRPASFLTEAARLVPYRSRDHHYQWESLRCESRSTDAHSCLLGRRTQRSATFEMVLSNWARESICAIRRANERYTGSKKGPASSSASIDGLHFSDSIHGNLSRSFMAHETRNERRQRRADLPQSCANHHPIGRWRSDSLGELFGRWKARKRRLLQCLSWSLQYETRTLKRGLPEMFFNEIKFGDKDPVQHVCFVVHGIGEACDTKFRPLIECVEDFRETSRTILQSHFKTYVENGDIHRVVSVRSSACGSDFHELHYAYLFLGIPSRVLAWRSPFGCRSPARSDPRRIWRVFSSFQPTGVDNHLLSLTLPSVVKLRTFINTTLSDILFYTSPVYCQVERTATTAWIDPTEAFCS